MKVPAWLFILTAPFLLVDRCLPPHWALLGPLSISSHKEPSSSQGPPPQPHVNLIASQRSSLNAFTLEMSVEPAGLCFGFPFEESRQQPRSPFSTLPKVTMFLSDLLRATSLLLFWVPVSQKQPLSSVCSI